MKDSYFLPAKEFRDVLLERQNLEQIIRIAVILGSLLVVGTLVYHNLEGWSYVNSLYFSSMTLTTIGYGDLVPTTDLAKIVTIFFAFSGVSIVLYSLSVIGKIYFDHQESRLIKVQDRIKEERRKALDDEVRIKGELSDLIKARKSKFQNRKYGF